MAKLSEKEREQKEEQRWLVTTQKKLAKYISNPYWDDLDLPDWQYNVISQIMSTKNVKTLSAGINERITDMIFDRIEKELKQIKESSKGR